MISAGTVQSIGTGSNAAKITVHGSGDPGYSSGVIIESRDTLITSVDGDISLSGAGGGYTAGIRINGGTLIQSTGTTSNAATINIHGMSAPDGSIGVGLEEIGTAVTSHSGDIQITGEGISIKDAVVASTGSGSTAAKITIEGMPAGVTRVVLSDSQLTSVDGDIVIAGVGGSQDWRSRGVDRFGPRRGGN